MRRMDTGRDCATRGYQGARGRYSSNSRSCSRERPRRKQRGAEPPARLQERRGDDHGNTSDESWTGTSSWSSSSTGEDEPRSADGVGHKREEGKENKPYGETSKQEKHQGTWSEPRKETEKVTQDNKDKKEKGTPTGEKGKTNRPRYRAERAKEKESQKMSPEDGHKESRRNLY